VHNAGGVDITRAIEHVRKHKSLEGFDGGDPISNEELLTVDVDVLVPAALENVITSRNAAQVRARIVVEGANGPTTAPADAILAERGVLVVPDILANAGGVTVSYFEWVQNRAAHFWPEDVVNDRLREIMTRSFHAVLALAMERGVDLRTAAYMLAIGRVATVQRLRGIYA
jgi:glutamate dehydrogenase (NAD(P)+)